LLAGKLYIPQERAASLEKQLADPALRGIVTLRVRENGRYTPLSIRFEQRTPQPEPSAAEPGTASATTP
jgi:hypothetical protein